MTKTISNWEIISMKDNLPRYIILTKLHGALVLVTMTFKKFHYSWWAICSSYYYSFWNCYFTKLIIISFFKAALLASVTVYFHDLELLRYYLLLGIKQIIFLWAIEDPSYVQRSKNGKILQQSFFKVFFLPQTPLGDYFIQIIFQKKCWPLE